MKLVPIALIALSLLVGCSDSTGVEKGSRRYSNGQKIFEVERKNGEREGLWLGWHRNGQKESEGEFKSGKREGRWTFSFDNGQKSAEGEYRNGKAEGPWTIWNKDSTLNTEKSGIYKADKKVADLPKEERADPPKKK